MELGLVAPTTDLLHRIDGLLSIDHIAVPAEWFVHGVWTHDAEGLSDHDGYAVEVSTPAVR